MKRILCGLVVLLGIAVGAPAQRQGYGPPPPPQGMPMPQDVLANGGEMHRGDALVSQNGRFVLEFQRDGNVVLKRRDGDPLWATNTAGQPAFRLIMQQDGNLVLYGRGGPLWSSNTPGRLTHHGQVLRVQDDGNLVIYSRGQVLWSSGTNGRGWRH